MRIWPKGSTHDLEQVSRGTFTAVFFIQSMAAIGAKTIHLEDA
jgi:hypothetical protein